MTVLTKPPMDHTLRSINCFWEFGRVADILSLKHSGTLIGSVHIKDNYYAYHVEEGPNLGNSASGSDLMNVVLAVESMALGANPKVRALVEEAERVEAESVHAAMVTEVINFMSS